MSIRLERKLIAHIIEQQTENLSGTHSATILYPETLDSLDLIRRESTQEDVGFLERRLDAKLAEMELRGFVERIASESSGVQTSYRLTSRGFDRFESLSWWNWIKGNLSQNVPSIIVSVVTALATAYALNVAGFGK